MFCRLVLRPLFSTFAYTRLFQVLEIWKRVNRPYAGELLHHRQQPDMAVASTLQVRCELNSYLAGEASIPRLST